MLKISTGARAVAVRLLAGAACIQLLCGDGGCSAPYPSQEDARLTIDVTQPSGTYEPGETVTFRVTVTNAGTRDVNDFTVWTTPDRNLRFTSATCSGQGPRAPGATTDPTCERFVSVYKLAPGHAVTVDVVETVHAALDATAANRITVIIPAGPGLHADNAVSVADTRGGTYRAYSAAGQVVEARVDFASASLAFGDTGATTRFLRQRSNDETWDMADGAALRAPRDLLVGTADLGAGIQPFIAARKFVATIAALDGRTFDTFGLDISATGSAATRVRTTAFDGATMRVCADAVAHAIATCPPPSLHAYTVSVDDGVFSALEATSGQRLAFQVAQSGDAMILLRSQATADGHVFQVGLSTNAGVGAVTFQGGDTLGRWRTVQLLPSTHALREGVVHDTGWFDYTEGSLSTVPDGPAGLAAATLGDAASTLWLAQDGPLAVIVGQPGGSQAGLLQVFSR